MKFGKKYQEYIQAQEKKLPGVGFKKLKKILNKCRRDFQSKTDVNEVLDQIQTCPQHCPVCDGTFFPSLLQDMSDVVGCFNERAKKLLEVHQASGFRKYFLWYKGMLQSRNASIQEGKDLINYALINAIAFRKILKKYDKVHPSKKGQAFMSEAQRMHMEILQSPWLWELMAFHINAREANVKSGKSTPALFEDSYDKCYNDGKPCLCCQLFDSVKLDIDLICSICLDTVFDPVSLTCGHIFCYMCACSAASVTIVDGLKDADPKEKCPLCREVSVYLCPII
ncbi:hypothetical protein DITRI_Ditri11bG0107700 [Diplodiscus trichospermus]